MKKKTLISEVRRMQKIAGILKEEKFYAPSYVAQKYGDKAREIEANIEDEEDNNPNIWDLYTSLETAEETDEFVKGFMNEGETQYYVHDEEGLEEPIGPFTMDQAKQELAKQGPGWKMIDATTAKQIWSHLEDDMTTSQPDAVKKYAYVDKGDELPARYRMYDSDEYVQALKNMNEDEMYTGRGMTNFQKVNNVSFPNGLKFRVGGEDPEGGKVISIEKYKNGYGVSGMEWNLDLDQPGEEGYTYYYDLQGNEASESDILR